MSFELGNWFIKRKKTNLPSVSGIVSALVIVLVIYLTREETLNMFMSFRNYLNNGFTV